MPWYSLIILGFVFIAAGVCTWLKDNKVEKVYTETKYTTQIVNKDGTILHWNKDFTKVFQRYRLVEKDN